MLRQFPKLTTLLLAGIPLLAAAAEPSPNVINLAGEWRFQLDAEGAGLAAKWHTRQLDDTIHLPGTTDTNRKGIRTDHRPIDRLARVWSWIGPAWYQRDITIPGSWQGKRVTLFLERTKNTRVWLDGTFVGREDSLSAPHVFDLTRAVKPGTHTITVLVDNAKLPPVGPAHAVDERTQTNWNGIVGRMELFATDPVWIDDVRVYPDVSNKNARVRATIGNITGTPAKGRLTVGSRSYNIPSPTEFRSQTVEVAAPASENVIEFTYTPGGDVPLWSEFQPALMKLDLTLEATAADGSFSDRKSVRFGMREFTRDGHLMRINGRPVFLRGRLDCANYPLTGYAPMSPDEWRRIFRITKAWGINHCRFHSWCPPAAAFEAADELGVYLQAELPNKRSAFNAPDNEDAAVHNIDFMELETVDPRISLHDYAKREGGLIFRHFANSPSFVMFTLGNELGRNQGMFDLVAHFKRIEPRMLHAQGANNMHWDPSLAEGDDFWVTAKVGNDTKPLRGSYSLFDFADAHIESRPPSTMVDFSKSIEGVPVPLIGHETGQYQVFPDFRDIPKFTGVLEARNYQIFRERLDKAGMPDQAHDFVKASGALAAICYREDIEAALRTPGFGGFQLLDIMDFPGQGTALVGMLNVFMESKGVIGEEHWRRFCSETVPLLRMEKYAWTDAETFTAKVQVAHHGPADLMDAVVSAELTGMPAGPIRFTLPKAGIKSGGITDIGTVTLDLKPFAGAAPRQVMLSISIEGTPCRNSYPLWIYPAETSTAVPAGVIVSRSFNDARTRDHLTKGGKVLLFPPLDKLPHSVPGGFQCEFWSPMFAEAAVKRGETRMPPGTLGILCDPAHAALAGFPTEFHSNWQWWHLVKNSRPIAYDGSPHDFRPVVQVIDNFARNHKLGLIAETRVGKGSMLICSIDLPNHQDKPEARQLLHSLLQYLASPRFAPRHALDPELLGKLLPE